MLIKGMHRKSLVTMTIFCLSMLSLFGLVLTNDFFGTRVAKAAVTSWNIGTDGDLLITTGGEYYVTGSTAANIIKVNTGDPVSITLDNVSIDVSGTAGTCAFDSGSDVTLYLKGTNSLKSGDLTLEGVLGQPGLKVQQDDSLVIYEDSAAAGSLTATGGNRGAGIGGEGGKDGGTVTIESGTVAAVGGLGAAGIGGGGDVWVNNAYTSYGGSGGLLTVNGGIVTATGGKQGAGIGSGVGEPQAAIMEKGETRINGGTVSAVGGELGAGIGGGCYRSNGTVFISGGIITATGGPSGAGVGGGYLGAGGTVTIQGGELIANGGGGGAGIGGGVYGSGAVVEIENATVNARGGGSGAGIGSGGGAIDVVNSGTVNIISGTITAIGGSKGAGIGGGEKNNGADVTINGGTVTATGGTNGAGIGGGASSVSPGFNTITHGGKLTVNDGEVTASGGQYSAGIGGGYWGSGAEVVINGGRVEAYGSGWGAGIGGGGYGGEYGTVGTATINGGYVKAVGGESAAGIGGGYLQPGGEVTIGGGEVIAQGGADGAGIGGGREKAGGTVIISGGSVAATGGNLSAGIGGGAYGFGGTVTISNGTVTAIGGTNGAGIGAGLNSPGGEVTITGGSIKAVGNNSDDIGGSGGAKGTGTLTNGTEPLERRLMENSVAEEDPEPVNIQLTVTRSTPYDYSYVYSYFGKGHGTGDPDLYFYLPVRIVTSLSLASSQNPSSWGDPVTLTAGLGTASATGLVKFFDGDVLLGTAMLNNGQAVFDIDSLLPGVHALRAKYQGDEFYAPSTTVDLSQTVNKLPIILTLSGDPNPAAIGAAVNFTASVDPAAASGQVEFYNGETLIDTLNLADGSAVLTTDELTLGTHSIKAVYQGDEYYAAGNSNVVEQEIIKVPTAITLTSSRNPSAFGESVVFTATIDPLSATGSIDFYDNGVWMGRTPISEGNALFATYYSLTLGSHYITAEYAGNEIYAPCLSDVFDQSVRPRLSGISVSFNQGSIVIYPATSLDNLKSMLTVTAQYDDGSSSPVAATDYTLSGTLTAGTSVITVQYGGKETTFTVNVTAKAVTGISITKQPIKTSYIAGQSFDPAGMEVTVQYNDGTSEVVTGYTYAPSGALSTNDTKVSVTYAGETADVTIDVFDKSVSGINASFNQGSMVIYPATFLDTLKSVLTVTAQYDDGSSSPVEATDYTLSGTLTAGTSVITVQYGGKETTFTVNVTARAVTGIGITKQPIKTSYIAGQSFDPAGMEVTAQYNDGTSEAVIGYTYAPSGALSTSDTKVTVTYAGKTADVAITVTTSDLNKTITGVQVLDLISVPKGTSREKLPLPSEVLVTLSNGAMLSCPVSWNNGNPEYNSDPGKSTTYTFIGTLNCPSGVINPIDLHAIAIVNVFGAIPNNSVIIWSKAYSIDYMMKENNLGEINQAIAQAGLKPIYFQLPGVAEVFTDVFTMVAATQDELIALPEIEYTDAQGNKTTYAAGFGEAIPPGV